MSQRILVIEDNPKTAENLALYLRNAGYEVTMAHDGLRGLERARRARGRVPGLGRPLAVARRRHRRRPGTRPHRPYVFERFYRTDPSRHRGTGGAGLGLAIVKQLVEAHGGRVAAASEPGRGCVFTLTLPAAGDAAVTPVP